jgi:phosphoserine phosphatase RsbU/P
LQVANSGLPRPLYCVKGKVQVIEATGLPLGLFDEVEYDEFSFKTKPGDLFVFFSDGILDARDAAGDLFGRQQVEEIVAENWEKTAGDVVQAIFQAVSAHTGGAESFDDETVVVIKVKAGSGAKK